MRFLIGWKWIFRVGYVFLRVSYVKIDTASAVSRPLFYKKEGKGFINSKYCFTLAAQ